MYRVPIGVGRGIVTTKNIDRSQRGVGRIRSLERDRLGPHTTENVDGVVATKAKILESAVADNDATVGNVVRQIVGNRLHGNRRVVHHVHTDRPACPGVVDGRQPLEFNRR